MKRAIAGTFAAIASAFVWYVACKATGQVEAWDSPAYAQLVLPSLGLLTALLGFWTRGSYLELGIAASLGQLAGMFATSQAGSMWPIGVGFLVLLSLPLGFTAWLGGKARGCCTRAGRVAARHSLKGTESVE